MRQVDIQISNKTASGIAREFGDISFTARTLSQDLPIQLKITIIPYHDKEKIKCDLGALYSGEDLWNLNPGQIVFGHFRLPIDAEDSVFHYRVEVFWSIVDVLNREHAMLPFSFVWSKKEGDWWFDPRVLHAKD